MKCLVNISQNSTKASMSIEINNRECYGFVLIFTDVYLFYGSMSIHQNKYYQTFKWIIKTGVKL